MMIQNNRITIIRGEDKTLVFKLRDKENNDPVNLNNITSVSIELIKSNRAKLIRTNKSISATKAVYSVVEDSVTYTFEAQNGGGLGNDIFLQFDGIDDIDTIIAAWNTNNPTNQVVLTEGDGTVVLSEQDVQLYGGLDEYQAVSVEDDPILGKLKLILLETETISLRRGDNQLIKITVDWGNPPSGIRKVIKFYKLDVCDPTSY